MATLVALYKTPVDSKAFDEYYFSTHIPLAKTIPGLRRCEVSKGAVSTPQGESSYHMVAILSFDSAEALQQGLASAEGKATAGDIGNFAQAGVELLVFDSKVV
ncbi:MAG: EthD family reductase [Rhodanobacter sp.]